VPAPATLTAAAGFPPAVVYARQAGQVTASVSQAGAATAAVVNQAMATSAVVR